MCVPFFDSRNNLSFIDLENFSVGGAITRDATLGEVIFMRQRIYLCIRLDLKPRTNEKITDFQFGQLIAVENWSKVALGWICSGRGLISPRRS